MSARRLDVPSRRNRSVWIFLVALAGASLAHGGEDWTQVEEALDSSPFKRGALVIHSGGSQVYLHGFGWWSNRDSADDFNSINVASLSKTITALLAMAVLEDANVDLALGDLAKKYIPDANTLHPYMADGLNFDYDVVTIRHLLSMTTGHDFPSAFPLNPLNCVGNNLISFETCGELTVERQLAAPPGDKFSYSNLQWQILGLVLVRAVNDAYDTTMDFEDIVEEYLTGPAACDWDDTVVTPTNNEWPAGGFETDLEEGGLLAEVLLDGTCGPADSHVLLSASARAAMRVDQVRMTYGIDPDPNGTEVVNNPSADDRGYGLGLWNNDFTGRDYPQDAFMGIGAWGAIAFFYPDGNWSAYLHLNDRLLTGYADATVLVDELIPLIDAQLNP